MDSDDLRHATCGYWVAELDKHKYCRRYHLVDEVYLSLLGDSQRSLYGLCEMLFGYKRQNEVQYIPYNIKDTDILVLLGRTSHPYKGS